MNSKKVVLFSNEAAGKTTFVMSAIDGNYQTSKDEKYNPTIGVEVSEYKNLVLWDCAGKEMFGGLRDGYYIGCNIGLLFAINSEKLEDKYLDFIRVTSVKPIVTSVKPIVITIKNLTKEKDKIAEFCKKYELESKEIDNLNKDEVKEFLDRLIFRYTNLK